jgi:hypothetical protein
MGQFIETNILGILPSGGRSIVSRARAIRGDILLSVRIFVDQSIEVGPGKRIDEHVTDASAVRG